MSKNRGFTLFETLIALAVLGVFFAAVSVIIQQILQLTGQSRLRTTALALAQSKIEIVRNLPYQQVGTVGGIPQGPLVQTETITVNSQPFTVKTSVVYIDDPFDAIAPNDLINTDYKRARIEVTWSGPFSSTKPVTAVTNIAPKGIETITGGGTLYVQVFDANALPVPNATVKIDNTGVNPEIHTSTLTSTNGFAAFPGAPACITCYQITVTKNGYSTDKTYGTSEVTNALQPHTTIIEGEVTQVSFSIDLTGSVTIRSYGSRASGYPPVAAVFFTIRGSKIIGYDSFDEPVYKYSYSTNTGGSIVTIPGLEWDTYTLDFSNSGHALAGSNPVNPFALLPGQAEAIDIVAVPKANTTLLVTVIDNAGNRLASASAHLKNSGSYDSAIDTGATGAADFGQAFFDNLTPGGYSLSASFSGYLEATSSVTISGNKQDSLILNPNP